MPKSTRSKKSDSSRQDPLSKNESQKTSNHDQDDVDKELNGPRYWLIKSEPESRIVNGVDVKFSIDDLEQKQEAAWDGIRNYEARNLLRDRFKVGDICLFYHSNCKIPGIVGIAQVSKPAEPDPLALDKSSPYYDPKSSPETPRWFMVHIKYVKRLNRFLSLNELKTTEELKEMALIKRGRLSVQPVTKAEFDVILKISDTEFIL